jgi:2-polyprenyl-6-methoxyphenol hydroxylase-like FAD-dependent oxidoreductase
VNGTTRPLKVIIVGGGLGGLACGAALREYADVRIFESAPEIKEIGAAVHLAPNAYRIIKALGGDLAKKGCVPVRAFREWNKGAEITIDRALNPLESHGCEWVSLDFLGASLS